MPCYAPIRAFYAAEVNPTGKRSLVFKREAAFSGVPVRLPCGQCIGCRLERARQWAMRCLHEKRTSHGSEFLTLTYDDKHLPQGNTLVKRDMQLFMKRLRKEYGNGIRFFGCGEYGSRSGRPHYHILLFNHEFPDKRFYKNAGCGERLYYSGTVEKLWPYGFNVIGDVTFDSACYVARYICDKVTGDAARDHYSRVDSYGVIYQVEPEFLLMSRRPGIGRKWFDKFGQHAYLHDSVIINEREVRPPRYYDILYAGLDAKRMDVLKATRRRNINRPENTPERRRVRERVVYLNLKRQSKSEV